MIRNSLLLVSTSMLLACSENKRERGEHLENKAKYIKSQLVDTNATKLEFLIVSNPFQWTQNEHLIIYVDNKVAYNGPFEVSGSLHINAHLGDLINCRMEVIKQDKLYVYSNKSVFLWDDHYKYIYIGLFPENQNTDQIHFFPQKHSVIQ